jgi:hypothetical protein
MVMIALNKATMEVEAGSMKRSENRKAAVQVVLKTPKMHWITKGIIIRNVPITAIRPTPRLAAWRYYFAEAASAWKGAKGNGVLKYDSRSKKHKAGDLVLKVHEIAQEALRAKYESVKGTLPGPSPTFKEGKYRTYEAYRRHEKEELKKLAGMK